MFITFKSRAAADVMMYEEHAKHILDLLHKDVKRGVITVAELDSALATLEPVIAEARAHAAAAERQRNANPRPGEPSEEDDASDHSAAHHVSFSTRAYPFVAMLRDAKKAGVNVVWGV